MVHEPRTPSPESIQRVSPGEVRHCLQVVHPFSTVVVRGLVVELRGLPADDPKFVQGKLRDLGAEDGAILDFRCPIHQAPRTVQQVVEITGTLYPEVGSHDITVMVRGHCQIVDQRQLPRAVPKTLLPERDNRVRLNVLIEDGDVQRIAVIGTPSAHADILKALDHPYAAERLPLYAARVGQVEELVQQLHRIRQEKYDACVLAQTGSESTPGTWTSELLVDRFQTLGIPIYTALGHSGIPTPADHYADESFSTPAAFGAALKAAIDRVAQRQELIDARDEAMALHEKALTELRLERNAAEEKLQTARRAARRRSRRAVIWGVISGALIAAVAIWAAQQPWAHDLLQQYLP